MAEVNHRENVAPGGSRYFFLIISHLHAFRCRVESMPGYRFEDDPNGACMFFCFDNGDHSITIITEAKIGDSIANCLRFLRIFRGYEYQNRDMAIGRRKFVSVDIAEF